MTSFLRGNVVRILTLALALFGTGVASVAFSQTIDSNVNDYVTIKLKDGRVLEGPVLLENDQQITIESQFANGTITRKDQIDKSDIASISHMSAADRDQPHARPPMPVLVRTRHAQLAEPHAADAAAQRELHRRAPAAERQRDRLPVPVANLRRGELQRDHRTRRR